MTRHILRLQVIVLRYVKALLAFLTTALAVFTSAAVLLVGCGGDPDESMRPAASSTDALMAEAPTSTARVVGRTISGISDAIW